LGRVICSSQKNFVILTKIRKSKKKKQKNHLSFTFNIKLKKTNFFHGEDVTCEDKVGEVESWNNRIELLKLSSNTEFDVGDVIVGRTSTSNSVFDDNFNNSIRLFQLSTSPTLSSHVTSSPWKKFVFFNLILNVNER
jgi:hypothetical protein